MPTTFLRNLLPCIALSYGLQAAAGIPSIAAQTERFYDLSGSLTYLSCTALSLYLPAYRARAAAIAAGGGAGVGGVAGLSRFPSLLEALAGRNWRTVALSAAAGLWATRLGSFLFQRISGDKGRDSRFDDIRGSPAKFGVAFAAQATWVSLVLMPVLAVNALPASVFASAPLRGVMVTDVVGLALWVAGWTLEVTADRQKSAWLAEKKAKKHSEEFLTRGLWGRSRHPNYAGEIALWSGVAITAAGVLTRQPALAAMGFSGNGLGAKATAIALASVSPAFTTFLLTQVSGIPMSENKYDKRYGHRKDYQEWKRNTPVLIPKLW